MFRQICIEILFCLNIGIQNPCFITNNRKTFNFPLIKSIEKNMQTCQFVTFVSIAATYHTQLAHCGRPIFLTQLAVIFKSLMSSCIYRFNHRSNSTTDSICYYYTHFNKVLRKDNNELMTTWSLHS